MATSSTRSARRNGWLRVNDAARLLGVSMNTLRRWSDAGRLACFRSPGGHRRYRLEDIRALLDAQGRGPEETSPRAREHMTVPELRRRVADLRASLGLRGRTQHVRTAMGPQLACRSSNLLSARS